jgi:homogentisate 1,2-dioxygenase
LHLPREFRNPVGQLRMDAPYTHRDFVRPVFKGPRPGPKRILVKKDDAFVERFPVASPFDVVGWDGTVWPFAFDILKFQPKTGLVHLPPTVHSTFAGRNALVCSFVPRVTDTHPDAIPCPYPHMSVDCDEIIYYVRGNFTSRKGVGPKAVSLHPAGVPHGPHPGAYEGSIGTRSTDEVAVMMDTFAPLRLTQQALALESPGYHDSWISG